MAGTNLSGAFSWIIHSSYLYQQEYSVKGFDKKVKQN